MTPLPLAAQQALDIPTPEVVIYVITKLDHRSGASLAANDLRSTIASFGGYLNRKGDEPLGGQTL